MRKLGLALLVAALTITTVPLQAQSPLKETKPFGVSFFHPVQYPDRGTSIEGIRLNAFYAVNRDVTGVDLGLIVPVNVVEGNFQGVQLGAVNLNHRRTKGLQIGIVNRARRMRGVQFGAVNMARTLDGLQIGLVNLKSQTRKPFPSAIPSPVVPLVNWSF